MVCKPLVPVGRDAGFLHGELDEKLAPYHASSYDAPAFILGREDSRISSLGSRLWSIRICWSSRPSLYLKDKWNRSGGTGRRT
ncbi:MAG TPA: hypothetical protein GXX51_08515 [Firmicutes bacterium]|nr:hypothetical protein [Bacillota bacterium]